MADRRGLRKGTDARIRVTFIDGNRPVNWQGRSLTATGRLDGSASQFNVATQAVGGDAEGKRDVLVTAAQLPASSGAKHLLLEFTISGVPTVNSPEKPLKVPLRDAFGDGPDR